MDKMQVISEHMKYRKAFLNYTNTEVNLVLENDEQVYIAVFDIPTGNGIPYGQTKTLALIFGLNVHEYFSDGDVITELEKI